MNKTMKAENLFLKKKRQEVLEKNFGCNFIRINPIRAGLLGSIKSGGMGGGYKKPHL